MRKLVSVVLLLSSAGVYALGDCNGNQNCNDTDNYYNTYNKGGDGGDGGNGYGGYAKAYGGNAYQNQRQQQGQDQYQGQYQGNLGINKAVGTGNETNISFGEQTIEAEPAIAPAIAPPDPTAPCLATYGASGAGGGVVSLGFSAYEYDEICGGLEFYRVVGSDPAHKAKADEVVGLAHAMLLQKIEEEMGPERYAAATVKEDKPAAGTSASYEYPTNDGGFMRVSFRQSEPEPKTVLKSGVSFRTTADR
jgi:hypothetical protein